MTSTDMTRIMAVAFGILMVLASISVPQKCAAAVSMDPNDNPRNIWLFGDSLSAQYYGWAGMVDDNNYANIKNVARNGLQMIDLDPIDWVRCGPNHRDTEVILWIGSNDLFKGADINEFETSMRAFLEQLRVNECRVSVFLVPKYRLSDRTVMFRDTQVRVAEEFPNATVYDIYWDSSETYDGIHQKQKLHFLQAVDIIKKLGLQKSVK